MQEMLFYHLETFTIFKIDKFSFSNMYLPFTHTLYLINNTNVNCTCNFHLTTTVLLGPEFLLLCKAIVK